VQAAVQRAPRRHLAAPQCARRRAKHSGARR
jgi:hypothetical protein